ncbi:hypothetical protein GCM10008090_19380 [Arenicella chitinivorans]|uniref:DUF695 domain-containing protein n=1 Tax=Arenicella chitinivorans TaxID=1329800 RepID=A0A918VN84_9GAMM|nr:DUF695 domain-containing protein [Arenicella chitinivorans]GHA09480.1 hypothetical protein GCM10008090_19380 [Arenicella chitinivorans]
MNIEKIVNENPWMNESREYEDGSLVLLRFIDKLDPNMEFDSHQKSLCIFWDFEANDKGMPQRDVQDQMGEFEKLISNAVEKDLTAFLAGVLTMDGYRQWIYCCEDLDLFIERLNNITPEGKPFPIHLESSEETSWSYFFRIFGNKNA